MPVPLNGLHIEPTNICTLKCAGCARTRFITQWPKHWKNHSIDIDALIDFIDIDMSGLEIHLCGNYGDPIYHPDLVPLVKYLKSQQASVSITTNGSHRQASWWEQLVEEMDSQDTVTFSIDGVPENFMQYRENADWSSILQAIKICVASGIGTVWKYIPFSFNQNHIHQAQQLSQDLGMTSFRLTRSDRFDRETEHLMPDTDLLGERFSAQQAIKNQDSTEIVVDPKCHKGREHFISADGFYGPCCFIGDHRFYYKTFWGKEKKTYDIRHTTLTRLLAREQVIDFYRNIPKNPPMVCQYSCPSAT